MAFSSQQIVFPVSAWESKYTGLLNIETDDEANDVYDINGSKPSAVLYTSYDASGEAITGSIFISAAQDLIVVVGQQFEATDGQITKDYYSITVFYESNFSTSVAAFDTASDQPPIGSLPSNSVVTIL